MPNRRSAQPAIMLSIAAILLPAVVFAAPVNYEMNLHTASGMGAGGGVSAGIGILLGGKSSAVTRNMDLRLLNPTDIPSDYTAAHNVPEAMRIGPLLPLRGERRTRGDSGESADSEPEGRVLIYWGCSATVAKGQPEIIDFKALGSRVSPEVAAMARSGMSRGRDADAGGTGGMAGESLPARAIGWPWGDRDYQGIPDGASAVGEHEIKANFLNNDIRFTLGKDLDFLEPINLKSAADHTNGRIPLTWDALTRARGYDLNAVGPNGEKELVVWMAAKGKSPMLPGSRHDCTIPEGIFAKSLMTMVSAVAHGPTQGFAYPPQKPGDKKPLIWSARVRVNAFDSLVVGTGETAAGGEPAGNVTAGDAAESLVPAGVGGLLKGIFGR